jgi:hypothetical protein
MTKLIVAFRNSANAPKKRRTENRRIVLIFLKLDTACKGKVHAPVTLPTGESSSGVRWIGAQCWSGHFASEKSSRSFSGKRNTIPGLPIP